MHLNDIGEETGDDDDDEQLDMEARRRLWPSPDVTSAKTFALSPLSPTSPPGAGPYLSSPTMAEPSQAGAIPSQTIARTNLRLSMASTAPLVPLEVSHLL